MRIASHLSGKAGANMVLVSEKTYSRIEIVHAFVEYRKVDVEDVGRMDTWVLASSLRMPQEQILLVQTTFAKVLPIAEDTAARDLGRKHVAYGVRDEHYIVWVSLDNARSL